MARPVGEAHVLILQHIERAGPVTARELASGLQLSVRAACRYLHYLAATGRVDVVDRVRVPHMTRPAMRYQVRVAEQGAAAWAVLTAWPPRSVGSVEAEAIGVL
jgi:predicted ArsR family transcriptional regulator